MLPQRLLLPVALILIAVFAYAAPPQKQKPKQPELPQLMRWVSLSTDSRDTVREIIRSEVDSREGFSTAAEERTNLRAVEDEKEREDSDYKNSIIASNKEFARAKKKRDDATTQFQISSTDLDESAKGIKTIRTTIENLDGQLERYDQDIKAQQASLKRWLQTEKQGEILVAVIYTRGFKDSAHLMESTADKASAPLIATHMGTYVKSFTTVINNVTVSDFIRATEEGTAKWNNEEPVRIELEKNVNGTSYLRIKRYELYPFRENKAGKIKPVAPSQKYKVALITSRRDLDAFLKDNQFLPQSYELNRVDRLINDTVQNNAAAEEGLNEQVKSFQDRIAALQNKISTARDDKESQKTLLKRKEEGYYKFSLDVAAIRERKDTAERQFQQAQAVLHEKKRTHESIIIKTTLAATKGSQTPAEASAEAILDKLAEVKNDAKTQHSSSTTEVTNFRVTSESATQSITEARIIALRLISFINEGDSVRVKIAFRVKTILEEQTPAGETVQQPYIAPPPVKAPEKKKAQVAEKKKGQVAGRKKAQAAEPKKEQIAPPKKEQEAPPDTVPQIVPEVEPAIEKPGPAALFKRGYRPLAVKDALGCLFELRSVTLTKEGLSVLFEVINTVADARKVAFYDYSFPRSWTRTKIQDESGSYYEPDQAFAWQGAQKRTMMEIDRHGRGVEIKQQASTTMELVFKTIPAKVKIVKIKLHPFIYLQSGRSETWQEFDLDMPDMHIRR
jgi:hypothetical protein